MQVSRDAVFGTGSFGGGSDVIMMSPATKAAVTDVERLQAVEATQLLDTPPEEPFDRLARLAATVLEVPYAFVTVVDDHRSFWKAFIGVNADPDDPADRQVPVEESFCQYVVESGAPVIVTDTTTDRRMAGKPPGSPSGSPSMEKLGVRAWAGFPVRTPAGHILGTFSAVDTAPREWTARDLLVLETLAGAASGEVAGRMALENSRRNAEELARAAGELHQLARTLQESLLPPELPRARGLDIAAGYRPAGAGVSVLGDFYDVFPARQGDWHMLVGDVCGHGVDAAKRTSLVRWSVRAAATASSRPATILEQLNTVLLQALDDSVPLVTAQLATVSAKVDGVSVTLCGAGHPPALVRRNDGIIEEYGEGGHLLGVFENPRFATHRFDLARGEALVMYTDGLTEARTDNTMVTQREVHQALLQADASRAGTLVRDLEASALAASNGTLADDLALLVVRAP